MIMRSVFLITVLASANATATECKHPFYVGLKWHNLLRFVGPTGPTVESEHGIIETISPAHTFRFTTAHPNGYGQELVSLDGFEKVSSRVMRKNPDFTDAEGTASYLIMPDLDSSLYYATMSLGDVLHSTRVDDTYKFGGCGR